MSDTNDWGIFGQKGFGKTTLGTRMSWEYRQRGIETIVLDRMRDDRWDTDHLFGSRNDQEHKKERNRFEQAVRGSRNVAVFIDEAWGSMGQHDDQLKFISRVGRHDGIHVHYMTHRPYDLDKSTRILLDKLCLFALPKTPAEKLAEWWMDPVLAEAPNLEKFEYFQTSLSGSATKKKVTPR